MNAVALTPSRSLAELEAVVDAHWDSFQAAGNALAEIRDRALYHEAGHEDWDSYLRSRFSRSHAHRLKQATEVAQVLSPMGDTPLSERAARALWPVVKDSPERARQIVSELAREGGPITSGRISKKAQLADRKKRLLPELTAARDRANLLLRWGRWMDDTTAEVLVLNAYQVGRALRVDRHDRATARERITALRAWLDEVEAEL